MTDLDGLDRAPESSMAWASDWLNRLESVVERYPWPALLVALGVGYLMARRVR
jgi:predicted alpha/beta hydrolase family esterase